MKSRLDEKVVKKLKAKGEASKKVKLIQMFKLLTMN